MVPMVKIDFIRRAKLTQKLKAVSKYPLTVVHSGAGYGKSTALALFVNDEKTSCCWYSLSSTDDDILPFLTYIVSSVQTVIPNFGVEMLDYMNRMDRYIREEELSTLCSLFINEVLSVKNEIIIILDDYHEIDHSHNVSSWMEKMLQHIPPNLHIIISSRSRPMWDCITKMKVSGELLEITKEDLVLTKEEAEILLSDHYDISVSEEELDLLFELTEGWVIALGMIAQQILHRESMVELIQHPSRSLHDLFAYLVKEVFVKQPPLVQQFLEQTCIFDEMNEEICNVVLGITGSGTMLEQLTEKNLFIQKLGDNQYRYHALFREFLEKQLRQNQPKSLFMLHERSARYYERNELWEEAIRHYEKIGKTDAISAILHDYGVKMLEGGKLESLYDRLTKIPDRDKDSFYNLWFFQGEILRYRSLYKESEECYEKAIEFASQKGDVVWKAKALEGKARIYLDTIQPFKAERILYQAIQLREKLTDPGSELETGRLYRLQAENLINSGQALKAEKWIERARSLNVALFDGNLIARLMLRTGRLAEAKRNLLLTKQEMKRKVRTNLPQSHRETDLLLALIESFMGNAEISKELAQQGIQHGISSQSPFVEACGWMRMGHAVQLMGKYDLNLAVKCYETSLTIMDELHVSRGKAEPLMGLCILYASQGDFERAVEAGTAALEETEKVKDVWLSSLINLCIGISAIYNNRFLQAENQLEHALERFRECGDDYGRMLCYLWKSHMYHTDGEQEQFGGSMSEFLKLVQLGDFEFIFTRRTIFGPRDLQMFVPLLIGAQERGVYEHYVNKLLQDMNLSSIKTHPGYTLRIQTLGHFRVWLGDKEIEENGWQRGKAKELLQLFITKRRQLLPKEDIFQILWPDQDEKSASRDFKVALNALNNVLEPYRKARSTPFFTVREGSAYGLNPKAALELDSDLFEKHVQDGLDEVHIEKAVLQLQKGLQLYIGEYLPERRFDDWCITERERLLVYFLRGAEKLAQLSVRSKTFDSAIHWCHKILEKDRTWEEAYRLLMFSYYQKNNRPQAIKWYQKCCEVLNEDLGVTPLEPTINMYKMILESSTILEPDKQP